MQNDLKFSVSVNRIHHYPQGAFDQHDVQNGVDPSRVYRSDDYRNLYNLVTHTHRRAPLDVGTKYIIAGILVRFLKAAGYFEKDDSKSAEILIGM